MKNQKEIITMALAGIAIGSLAYYFLATKQGKKALKNNKCCIKSVTKALKKRSKKCKNKATKVDSSAKNSLENKTISDQ